ncbi:MAG TPA: M20/M25/M40 family metallo-hydrolase, partial [Streptosporangiaceae bacterium]|nr:M20/M25/M40 family metallo-hydrolase [Streptosporangiaceae bacterium]
YVADWAKGAGLTAEIMEETPGRPSVVVRGGGSSARSLLLCGHLDTVGVSEMSDPLSPVVRGDRLYGRGAYDMKGGLAAALIAGREAARRGLEVIVAAVADEEHSSLGVQEVLRHVRADAAIVTEPTELTVATAHRGFVWTEIGVAGVAAHGSRPHLGVDAIMKTGPILTALDDLNERLRGQEHPRLGRGFVHASLIQGGREESTIPDSCTLTIERRTLPGETTEDTERDIAGLLDRCRAADPALRVSSRTTLARAPFEVADDEPIVQAVARATEATTGKPAELAGASYWADAAFIAAAGIPTVLFGPDGDGAHAREEWVSLPGTVACAQALTAAALDFCGG